MRISLAKKIQKLYVLNLEHTIKLIDEVVTKHYRRGLPHNWNLEPLAVISLFSAKSKRVGENYYIQYKEARKILDNATIPKLGANMNRGLGEIKERIRKMKIELTKIQL